MSDPDVDVSGTQSAEFIEALKGHGEALDAPSDNGEPEEGAGPEPDRRPAEPTVTEKQIDDAVGKLWRLGWSIGARRLDEPKLREGDEEVRQAKAALGPLARKYFREALARAGPETIATLFLVDTAERKWRIIQNQSDSGDGAE